MSDSNILQKIVPYFLFVQGAYVLYHLKQAMITFVPNLMVIGGALIILTGGLGIVLAGIGILFKKRWAIILYWIFAILLLLPLFQRAAIFTIIKPQFTPAGLPVAYEPMSAFKIWFDYFIKTIPYILHYIIVTYFTMKFWKNWSSAEIEK